MNFIVIMRKSTVSNHGTRRYTSKLLCAVYSTVERRDGGNPRRIENTAMDTTVKNLVLKRRHQTEGYGFTPVPFRTVISAELNR